MVFIVFMVLISDQCKEIEKNNRMGKTRDLFKKIRDTKGAFHTKIGTMKERNGTDLTEAEDIKKKVARIHKRTIQKRSSWPRQPQWCDHSHRARHPGVQEWTLGSITTNKANGGDEITVELFQILKDDAVKVLHSICQQIRKTQQWPRTGKDQFSF